MTHVGPHSSSTTIDRSGRFYYTGSKTLDGYLTDHHEKILFWTHGHTHEGQGVCRIDRVPIMNPGPMTHGSFGVVRLEFRRGEWGVGEIRMFNLNTI